MKRFLSKIVVATALMIFFIITCSFVVGAAKSGDYTYKVYGDHVSITGVSDNLSGNVKIPSKLGGYPVETIDTHAFASSKVTSITIPDTVTDIVYAAFADCRSLKSVTIPNSVKTIETMAFADCTSLKSVTIPKSVTSMDGDVFNGCTKLTTINLHSEIPVGYAFYGCSALKEFTVDSNNKVYSAKDGVLFNKSKSELVLCPSGKTGSYIIPNGVKTIKRLAFSGCKKLTNVKISNSVKTIESYAFESCNQLASITIPDSVKTIQQNAFSICENLKKITIGAGVTTDLNSAMDYLLELEKITVSSNNKVYASHGGVLYNKSKSKLLLCPMGKTGSYTIPNGVKTIGDSAFNSCEKLTSITIPASVKTIQEGAFIGCNGLKTITVNSNNKVYSVKDGVLFNKNKSKLLLCPAQKVTGSYTIPNGVKTIGTLAFYGCEKITSVTIPNSVKTIEDGAFANCIGLNGVWYTGSESDYYNLYVEDYWCSPYRVVWHYDTCSGSHSYSNRCDATCNKCEWKRTAPHNYKVTTTKATMTKNGAVVKKCTTCGKKVTTKVYRPYSIKLSTTSYVYNGSVRIPTVKVKGYDGKTIPSSSYTVKRLTGCKNVGTQKLLIQMKGNYTGTKTLTFKINPQNVSGCKLSLSATSYTYNGAVKTPTVTVKNASGTKLSTASYTVTYASGRKSVGTYKVTVKMKGNYTGTKTLTFKIKPKAASINTLTGGTKAVTVKLNRSLQQSTGYEVQYSTSKAFTSAKTVKIANYKTSLTTLKSLKAKTTYYVRVRTYKTVNGTKYYSNWSTAKSVKTK